MNRNVIILIAVMLLGGSNLYAKEASFIVNGIEFKTDEQKGLMALTPIAERIGVV